MWAGLCAAGDLAAAGAADHLCVHSGELLQGSAPGEVQPPGE